MYNYNKLYSGNGKRFWQISLKREDRLRPSIHHGRRVVSLFCNAVFGLCSALSTFQRMMDLVVGGLRWTTCLVYLDDIIVYAHNTEQHLQRLRKVLDAFGMANLRIKLGKCRFGERELSESARHLVSGGGINPDPEKVKVSCSGIPRTARECKASRKNQASKKLCRTLFVLLVEGN